MGRLSLRACARSFLANFSLLNLMHSKLVAAGAACLLALPLTGWSQERVLLNKWEKTSDSVTK